jgi:hypothetical protein
MRRLPPTFALLLLVAAPIHAQQIHGVVLEDVTRRPLALVELTVLDGNKPIGKVVSDTSGHFEAQLSKSGAFKLIASRLGYKTFTSERVEVGRDELVDMEIFLAVNAIPLEPLRVTARSQVESEFLTSVGYYDRQKQGIGHFLSGVQIEKRNAVVLSEVLTSVPGVKLLRADRGVTKRSEITFGRGAVAMRQCVPAVFIDGALARMGGQPRPNDLPLDDWVMPRDIEAVELYHGAASAPPMFNQQAQCGVVAIWTKRRK